jgi:hypothetical protein
MYNWFTNLNKKNEKHGSWNSELMNVSVGPQSTIQFRRYRKDKNISAHIIYFRRELKNSTPLRLLSGLLFYVGSKISPSPSYFLLSPVNLPLRWRPPPQLYRCPPPPSPVTTTGKPLHQLQRLPTPLSVARIVT